MTCPHHKESTAKWICSCISSAGAHHSNGLAERGISIALSLARAQMHHQAIHWPEVSKPAQWPLAVLNSLWVANHIPQEDTGLSPYKMFTKQKSPDSKLHNLHVWDCPASVLDKKISDGHKLPRWSPRSARCVYMGMSPKHLSVAVRVLNLDTRKITTQYHVIFDDWFQTVDATPEQLLDFDSTKWYNTFGATEWQYIPNEGIDAYQPSQETDKKEEEVLCHHNQVQDAQAQAQNKSLTLDNDEPTPAPSLLKQPPQETVVHEHEPEPKSLPLVTPGEPELATRSSPSAGWHNVEHASPCPTNSRPPMLPAKTAMPCQLCRLAGLPTENNGLESTLNYVNTLCNNREEQCWENLYAHFVTTSPPPNFIP